jgi:hypothetical protein
VPSNQGAGGYRPSQPVCGELWRMPSIQDRRDNVGCEEGEPRGAPAVSVKVGRLGSTGTSKIPCRAPGSFKSRSRILGCHGDGRLYV